MSTYLVDIVTTETKRNVLQISVRKKGVKNVMCAILHFLSYYTQDRKFNLLVDRLATFVVGL